MILAVVSGAPDTDAFLGGFQVVMTVGFVVMVGLIGLSILRRVLGS